MRALLLAALLLGTATAYGQAKQPEKLELNFNDADIVEVVRFVAQMTDRTVIIDPRVKGKVQVFTNGAVTKEQAYNLLLSILEIHGFTAFENNGVTRVVPNKDVRSSPIPVNAVESSLAGDEYVTEVIVLRNISAAKVLPVLRPLVAQHAHMAAYDPSNSIVISDTSANIARVKKVIDQIDGAAVANTEIIELQFAPVTEAITILEQLLSGDAGKDTGTTKLVPDTRTNSLILSGDELQRARVRSLVNRLDRPQAQTGNVRVLYLEYANATEVAQVLTRLLQNMGSASGGGQQGGAAAAPGNARASVEADETTNALLITAEGDTLDSLLQVVERLDIRRAQVLVEAVIAEIEDDNSDNLGVEWLFADQDGGFGGNSPTGSVFAPAGAIFSDNDDVIEELGAALSNVSGAFLGVGDFQDDRGFIGLINALQSKTNTNILSTPSVLTTDNHEAEIAVGQEVPFITGSFTGNDNGGSNNPFQTIERQNVGITLRVTPQINEGDKIILDIEQEVSSIAPSSVASDVITNERSITTQVLASNGQVVILGGLMRDNVTNRTTRVPLLGSIPVVGRLFRTNNDTVTKSNLLVFIRATVIRDDDTLTGTTAEKYKFLREQQLQRREIKGNLTSKKLYPVVPEWPIAPDDDLAGYKATVEAIEAKRAKKAKKKNKSKSAETETE